MGEKYRSWSADEKMEIILAGLQGDQSVAEVCRQYDIQQSQYYQWRDIFFEKGREGLKGHSTDRKVSKLRKQLDNYKKMVGELQMKNEILKKTFRNNKEE